MLDNASDKNINKNPEITPDDYYFNEEGLMVFTAKYHLKRGYCCKSGCLNCPWNYKKKNKI
ncbi:MAG: hypothetical protein KIT33_04580 [Candidatus Kapabacteria bacterium]|nr:hypothetical protein [Ignavibacteriota bacterium]MCW5884233.1 hypothetical protein [Candidatus Kapabacteria bacterium]